MTFEEQPGAFSFSRSPIIYEVSDALNGSADFVYILKLFVWTGASGAPGTADYTLQRQPNNQGNAVFDVSRLVKEFITNQNPSDLTGGVSSSVSDCVYIQATVEATYSGGSVSAVSSNESIATRGYVPRGDLNGTNASHNGSTSAGTTSFLSGISNGGLSTYTDHVLIHEDGQFTLGVFNTYIDEIELEDDNANTATITIPAGTASTEKLQYVDVSPARVQALGLSPTKYYYVKGELSNVQVPKTITFELVCETVNVPLQLIYVNALGVWDYMQFFKRVNETFGVTRQTHTAYDMPYSSPAGYDMELGARRTFEARGTSSYQLNTGFVKESEGERIKQLMVAERVIIYDGTLYRACQVVGNSVTIKQHVNEGTINYGVEVRLANDKF